MVRIQTESGVPVQTSHGMQERIELRPGAAPLSSRRGILILLWHIEQNPCCARRVSRLISLFTAGRVTTSLLRVKPADPAPSTSTSGSGAAAAVNPETCGRPGRPLVCSDPDTAGYDPHEAGVHRREFHQGTEALHRKRVALA